jgi:hypothetical protein
MQDETNSILYQIMQSGWSKKSIYTLKLLLNRMKQITKVAFEESSERSKRRKSKELRKTVGFPELAHATKMNL